MGQAGTKARSKSRKRIEEQKIDNARATGVLSLKESSLKHVPPAVWTLDQLKVGLWEDGLTARHSICR